jgi:hypothetical protein
MKFLLFFQACALVSVSSVACAHAEVTDWSVFQDRSECWAVTMASKIAEANGGSIGGVDASNSLLFASFGGKKVGLEVSFSAGHALADGSTVDVKIGSKRFEFVTDNDWAWPKSAKIDKAVAIALLSGSSARLTARHRDGRSIVYDFSLRGASSSIKEAAELCSVSLPSTPSSQAKQPRTQGDSTGKE